MIMVRERKFYKELLFLALPIVLQNVISFSVNLADNLMVGSLGEMALSGVYVSNQVFTMLQMIVMGLGSAMAVLAAQYWGKKDTSSVKSLIGIALRLVLAITGVVWLICMVFPAQVLGLFTDEATVIAEGIQYFRIICWTYVFFGITNVLIASMRCVGTVRIGMLVSSITLIINVGLNWVLIFGHLGAPRLGVAGAAIATLIARIVETIIMVVYVRIVDQKLKVRLKELLHIKTVLLKDFFRYGLPVLMGDVLWGINMAVQGAILGHLGSVVIAAASIANTIFSMMSVVVYATAGASAVMIGRTVGEKQYDKVKQYAKTLQVVFICIGLASALVLFSTKDYILLLYNVTPETANTARQFLTVLCITLIGTSYQMSVLTGIVRAGGATHFVLFNDIIFVWLIVIPSAYIAAFQLNAPAWVVFACLKCDQVLKCLVAVVKVNRFKWIKNLTRENV